jgi:dihydrodipicolinate synthase/N-acetylneuraminate lyase
LVTPRHAGGNEIDVGTYLELVDFACSSGLDGIVLLGSTGDFVHFDLEDRLKLIRLAIKRSRLPVTVNVSHSSLDGALALAREAVARGAATLLLMPPYFFRYSQDHVEEFFLRFARGLGNSVPLLLYNIPAFSTEIQFETLMRLLATGMFLGLKDSSGRLDEFRRMMAVKRQAPFTLLIGDDTIFTQTRSEGSDGGISGVAGAFPELMLGLEKAIHGGAVQKRDRLEARLHELLAWLARFPFPTGVKEAVASRGLKIGPAAIPASPDGERQLAEFREWLRGWLPKVLREAADA